MAPTTRAAANWATSRVVALLEFCALAAGVCVLLLWQVVTCIYKHARRTPRDSKAPQPRATPEALALDPTALALEDDANWAVERATGLPEMWALVAAHGDGLVAAWRLMRVCKAARAGAKDFLSTLPGLVVCGGSASGGVASDVLRLDLATMRWVPMAALVAARRFHACCVVRGALVVFGGATKGGGITSITSSVEMLSSSQEGGAFVDLPPLSRGGIHGAAAIAVDESDSAAGQVILL
jgi:hypothetical protein